MMEVIELRFINQKLKWIWELASTMETAITLEQFWFSFSERAKVFSSNLFSAVAAFVFEIMRNYEKQEILTRHGALQMYLMASIG